MPPEVPENKTTTTIFYHQQPREPSIFEGFGSKDPLRWMKDYERVAIYNRWDESHKLANVIFFLSGTARTWFENNEQNLDSWKKFEELFRETFGSAEELKSRAEIALKTRAQSSNESCESYIQDVLGLCIKINPLISEADKISHLMKGIAEEVYQALLPRDISTVDAFIKEARRIEALSKRRIKATTYARLPNVSSLVSIENEPDLHELIRRIVREEVQRAFNPVAIAKPPETIEDIVREEVTRAVNSVTPFKSYNEQWGSKNQYRTQTPRFQQVP